MYKIIETTKYYGHVLHKIEAIDTLTFGDIVVAPGTRGGWIESKENLMPGLLNMPWCSVMLKSTIELSSRTTLRYTVTLW